MSRRNKWILIGCLVCASALIFYAGYRIILVVLDMRMMESRRPVLLYQTDHRALLEACRELSRQVVAGQIEPGQYQIHGNSGDPDLRQFPKPILELDPLLAIVEKDGSVNLIMWPSIMYGVCAFPEFYSGSRGYPHEWYIKLIDGLWYYDEDFGKHPEHKKEVEELLNKRKATDSLSVP